MEKYVLSSMKDINFSTAVNELYKITDYNKMQYQNYYKWFYLKNIPRIINKEGEIIFYLDGFIVSGLIVLKNTDEKKICTLLINEEYRNKGISSLLLEESFKILNTDKPIITIPLKRLDEFKSIINNYNWDLSYITNEYLSKEAVFNKVLK